MKTLKTGTLIFGALLLCLCGGRIARSQEPPAKTQYFHDRLIYLQVNLEDEGPSEVDRVYLWVTLDNGKTWQRDDSAEFFVDRQKLLFLKYLAPTDGEYGFYSQAVKDISLKQPPPVPGQLPKMVAIVDTRAPDAVLLRPTQDETWTPGEPLTVAWKATDEYLKDIGLEIKPAGSKEWSPLWSDLPANGTRDLMRLDKTPFELRLTVSDRSGNRALSKAVRLVPKEKAGQAPNRHNDDHSIAKTPSTTASRSFEIHYKEVYIDQSGLKEVRLWYTTDNGQTWHYYGAHGAPHTFPFIFNAPTEDGLYGFRLIGISNAGILSGADPVSGDPPEFTTLIDPVPPVVCLTYPVVRSSWPIGSKPRLEWTVTEPYPAEGESTALFYRTDEKDHVWVRFAQLKATDRHYDWTVPRDLATRKIQIRVEVSDLAGNTGHSKASPEIQLVDDRPGELGWLGVNPFKGKSKWDGTGSGPDIHRPTDEPEPDPNLARTLFEKGIFMRDQQVYEKAAWYFLEAIKHKKGYVKAINELGVVYGEAGHVRAALNVFEKARNLAPGDPALYYNPGRLMYKTKKYRKALEMFKTGASMEPSGGLARKIAEALLIVARTLDKLGDHKNSKVAAKTVLAMEDISDALRERAKKWAQ